VCLTDKTNFIQYPCGWIPRKGTVIVFLKHHL